MLHGGIETTIDGPGGKVVGTIQSGRCTASFANVFAGAGPVSRFARIYMLPRIRD
jgi:hypothetical protein